MQLRAGEIYTDAGPAGVRPGSGCRFFVGFSQVGWPSGRRATALRPEGPSQTFRRTANEKTTPGADPGDEYHEAIAVELLDEAWVKETRTVNMETFNMHGVHEKRPIQEWRESTGKKPVRVKWVHTYKGDKKSPDHRSRPVARETKQDKR